MIKNSRKMPRSKSKSKATMPLLSLEEIILAIRHLPVPERQKILIAFQNDVLLDLKPLPYVITLSDDIPIDKQLAEIERQRKPIDWHEIDDIANKMNIQESIEELLESL